MGPWPLSKEGGDGQALARPQWLIRPPGSNGADSLIIWHIPRWLIFSDIQIQDLIAIISWDLNYVIFYDCNNFALLIPASLKVLFFDWKSQWILLRCLTKPFIAWDSEGWVPSVISNITLWRLCNIFLFFTMPAIQCERMCWVLSVITSVCLWLAPIVNEQASTQNIRVWHARKNYRW